MLTGQQLLNHNITITKKLSEGLPKILGDSNQLEQVFLNLISNAKDAMETVSGPKELTIHSYLSDEDESPTVAVSVKDTGEGIPEEILTRSWSPSLPPNKWAKAPVWAFLFALVSSRPMEDGWESRVRSVSGPRSKYSFPLPVGISRHPAPKPKLFQKANKLFEIGAQAQSSKNRGRSQSSEMMLDT